MKRPGTGFARRVTVENLDEFKPLLRQPGEHSGGDEGEDSDAPSTLAGTPVSPDLARAEALFQGMSVQLTVPSYWVSESLIGPAPPLSPGAAGRGTAGRDGRTSPLAIQATPVARGTLLWRKKLSKTDAQRQTGNITGELRLTRARFQIGGKLIDWTTYFRQNVFGAGTWTEEKAVPKVETADFDFEVTIRGQYRGSHQLRVSHKPTGEAGQGNYTTGIRWGTLSHLLRQVDISGATLSLYGPPAGATALFFIDID